MYRSASTSRVPDENYSYYTMSSSSPSSKVPTALKAFTEDSFDLPKNDPLSDPARKEKARAKFAEKAVHLIPLVLLLCGFVLWLFSNPNINVIGQWGAVGKVEGMAMDGDLDSDATRHLPEHLGDAKMKTKFARNTS